jgi:hypothetical protein
MAEDRPIARNQDFAGPLKFKGMADIVATYADSALVARTTKDFSIFFFQTLPPQPTQDGVPIQGESVEANCVARLVFAPQTMLELWAAMGKNLESAFPAMAAAAATEVAAESKATPPKKARRR